MIDDNDDDKIKNDKAAEQTSKEKTSKEKTSEERTPEERTPEERTPEEKTFVEKASEEKTSEEASVEQTTEERIALSEHSAVTSFEQELSDHLQGEDLQQLDPKQEAPKRLSPRYEIRIQAQFDPIVEETLQYRTIAQEIDGRYDRFVKQDPAQKPEKSSDK